MTLRMDICPICSLKVGEEITQSPFVPSMCWLETSRIENGRIQMKFGYGDDFDRIFYYPKYCPECGKKLTEDSYQKTVSEREI